MFEETIGIASVLIEENLYDKVWMLSSIGANHFLTVKLNFPSYWWLNVMLDIKISRHNPTLQVYKHWSGDAICVYNIRMYGPIPVKSGCNGRIYSHISWWSVSLLFTVIIRYRERSVWFKWNLRGTQWPNNAYIITLFPSDNLTRHVRISNVDSSVY